MVEAAGADWWEWHRPYEDPHSPLSRRLKTVTECLVEVLDKGRGRQRLISLCAGQGLDVLGALATRRHRSPGRADAPVGALLVERDERNAARACQLVEEAGFSGIDVRCQDASMSDVYLGWVPAEVVVVCGVFGNLAAADIEGLIASLPQLCATGGHVVWTRHRRPPDMTGTIRAWFAESGFAEVAFRTPTDTVAAVGVHRLDGPSQPLQSGRKLFHFRGDGRLPA